MPAQLPKHRRRGKYRMVALPGFKFEFVAAVTLDFPDHVIDAAFEGVGRFHQARQIQRFAE